MFRLKSATAYKELSAYELSALRDSDSVLIVDVREPDEFAAEHIEGAVNVPLSRFDPARLPEPGSRELVLQCKSGGRSKMGLDRCQAAQSAVRTHLDGGIEAWKLAGLPVVQGR